MASRSVRGDKGQLLIHLPEYGVIVCRQCKFAIQPSALSSHLLRHQIYRNERRELLQSLSRLGLKDPEDVAVPPHSVQPIQCLPVQSGHICLNCGHACVSQKRMSQHWSEAHGEHHSQAVEARAAKLQTFFRGNKLRYFEVAAESSPTAIKDESESHTTGESPFLAGPETPNVNNVDGFIFEDNGVAAPDDGIPHLDIPALRYLHHFITITACTVARGRESTAFWTDHIMNEAFQQKFLMFGILSTAAFHLAVLSAETGCPGNQIAEYLQAGALYQGAGLGFFRAAAAQPQKANSEALIAFARMVGIQRCAQARLESGSPHMAEAHLHDSPTAPILEFCLLIRGATEMHITLQDKLPSDSDFVLKGSTWELKRPLTADQLTTEGPHPFLLYSVMSQLESSALIEATGQPLREFISDRDLSRLCSQTLLLSSEEEITTEWITAILPNLSQAENKTTLLCSALRTSVRPAQESYQRSLVENLTPPFPSRSRFAHLSVAEYDRLAEFGRKMMTLLPPNEAADIPDAMPEFFALCHCFGRAEAVPDVRAIVSAVETWVYAIRRKFVSMIDEQRPVALLMFAQFCRLVMMASAKYWFVRGHPARLLEIVRSSLSGPACEIFDQI